MKGRRAPVAGLGILLLAVAVLPRALGAQACRAPAAGSLAVVDVARGIVEADNARDLERVLAFYAPDDADRRLNDAFAMVLGRLDGGWRITRLIWNADGG